MALPNQKKIISELLAIYSRYSREEIEDAIDAIHTGKAFEPIEQLALEFVRKAPNRDLLTTRREKARTSPAIALAKLISDLSASQIPHHRDVSTMLQAATRREVLPSNAAIQKLASHVGFSTAKKTDRATALLRLGRYLSQLDSESVSSILSLANDTRNRDSSLQRWTDIIVRRGTRDKD